MRILIQEQCTRLFVSTDHHGEPQWDWLWKAKVYPKIQMFIWQCLRNGVSTKEVFNRRDILNDDLCSLFKTHTETIEHVMRECCYAKNIWEELELYENTTERGSKPFWEWMEVSCVNNGCAGTINIPWGTIFSASIWSIWLCRNKRMFWRDQFKGSRKIVPTKSRRVLGYLPEVHKGDHKIPGKHSLETTREKDGSNWIRMGQSWVMLD